jgi:hypothetical protein
LSHLTHHLSQTSTLLVVRRLLRVISVESCQVSPYSLPMVIRSPKAPLLGASVLSHCPCQFESTLPLLFMPSCRQAWLPRNGHQDVVKRWNNTPVMKWNLLVDGHILLLVAALGGLRL